ncbi:MAG: S9 family peptidase [Bacillota bacterium]
MSSSERRPLRAEDACRFTPLGEPQISPDGSMVAFVRQYSDLDENETRTEIWTVSVREGTPRRLTTGGKMNAMPRWSPDGLRVAFISDRTGKKQIHIIDPRGGEAAPVATEEEPLSAPEWSPDGGRIAFVAAVHMRPGDEFYPGAPADSVLTRDEDDDDAPVVVKTLHHRQDGIGFFGHRFRHLFVVDAREAWGREKAETHRVTDGRYNHDSPAWSPDGRYLICTANRDLPDSDPVWVRHLWAFEVDSGDGVRVLREDYPVHSPRLSPDGRTVAFIGADFPFDWVSSPYNLFTVDFAPETFPLSWDAARNLTDSLDRRVGGAASSDLRCRGGAAYPVLWTADSRVLYTTVASEGESFVCRIPADGEGPAERVTPGTGRVVAAPALSRDEALVYLAGGPTEPDEVFILDREGCERRLTDINRPVAEEMLLAEPERMLFEGAGGWEIEGWLMRPPGAVEGERHPTVLVIHGGPSGMFGCGFSLQFQHLAGEGFAVTYLNPRGSSGYGAEFGLAVVGDWGGEDYRDLMAGVDRGIEMGIVDPERLGVTGWSYGGFMTCWIVTQTDRFSAAVGGAPVSDQYSMYGTSDVGSGFAEFSTGARPWENPEALLSHSPVRYMGEVVTPLLLLHGENDLRCPVSQSEEVFTALKRQGKECVLVRYPGEPHGLAKPRNLVDRMERTAAWFRHHLS